ncbi:MAG TPA: hypothetical protein VGG25_08415 [Streptosporangiaceae bacterium]|jgi:hypothetical protein
MRTEFRRAIEAAGEYQDAAGRITAIKRAVTSEIRAADPSVSVAFTDYFNNSLVPDMVLRWPTESRERLLYLRLNPSERWLLNGLNLVSSHSPLVFALDDLAAEAAPVSSARESSALQEEARASGTWITDPSGMAAVAAARTRGPSLGLLGQALVRGGRGVAGGEQVADLTEKTEAGFAGSASCSEQATRQAVEAIENNLDAEQSGRLTRLLRAVWEGHGGSSSRFPGAVSTGRLTDDDLSFLLAAITDAPADFWRRIGPAITTAQLGRLRIEDPSANLQSLVLANLGHLQARGVRVIDEPVRLSEPDDIPRWLVGKGCLALRGRNWTAYLAARRAEELPPADNARPPDLAALIGRAAGVRAPITQVQLGKDDRAVTYESKDGTGILDDPALRQVAAEFRAAAIEKASAALEGDRSIGIDFSQKTAIGPTSAVFPLGALVRSVLPLMLDCEDDELTALGSALDDPSEQDERSSGLGLPG